MTLLYYDPIFLDHDTGGHPENAGRLTAVTEQLNRSGLAAECRQVRWSAASAEVVALVHPPAHLKALMEACAQGGGRIEQDTVVSRHSCDAALMASGAACDAVSRVLNNEQRTALCLVRPPGHHALPSRVMGFCLLNHVAIAARWALRQFDVHRVLIVDWDVHHGNGTQEAFWEEPRVGFFSIHRWPFYPGTGAATETGEGAGAGTTCNLPVQFGTSRDEYRRRFTETLEQFAERMGPQLVLISAGFDAHRADPIGSLGLESEDFGYLTRQVLAVADQYAGGRVVSMLEGGYHPVALAESVQIHWEELSGRAQPA